MKARRRLIIPVALMALALCAPLHAQVLKQVPSSAIGVVKIRNLTAVNAKVIKLAAAFGLDQMAPEFKDPLGAFLEKGHLTQGINKDGDLAIALFAKPDGQPDSAPPPFIILVPVSDYKAFVGNFTDAMADGAITTAKGVDGSPVSIAQWGDYAAMATDKATLANKPDGFKVAGLAAKEADTKDVTVLANVQQIHTVGLPKLKEERDKVLAQVSQTAATDPNTKKLLPIIRAVTSVYITAIQDYLEQGTSGVFSIDLSDAGIAFSTFGEFKPESQLGQNFAALKGNSPTALFTGMPDRKYFLVGGFAADPKVSKQMIVHLIGPAMIELAAADDQFKQIGDLALDIEDGMTTLKSSAAGYIVPEAAAAGQGGILQTVQVSTGDAKTMQAAYRKSLTTLAEMMKAGPQSANAPMTFEFKQDAKTVDGVSFDQLKANLTTDPNDPKTAQAQQAIALLYGPNGIGSYAGVASDTAIVAVTGGDDQLISAVLASAKAGKDTISARPYIASVAAHLAKKPVATYYVFLDNIATSASKLAENFGFPIKLHLPENLPPIGFSVGAEGPSVRFDTFIPTELVQNLISAGLKARQDMQGGPGAQ